MKYLIILTITLLQACVFVPKKEPTRVVTTYDSANNPLREERYEDASVAADRDIEQTRRDCQDGELQRALAITDPIAQVAVEGFRRMSDRDVCAPSTNSNDVTIAANEERTEQVKAAAGTVPIVGTAAGAAYVGGKVAENRDATVVTQPAPLVVEQPEPILVEVPSEPVVIEPFIVNPVVITAP